MLTKEMIDNFYRDVQALGLRNPVTSIHKATGFNKGTVSMYLNRRDEPSENFIKAFYNKFGESLKNAPVSDFKPQYGQNYTNEYIQALEELNQVRRQREKDRANLEKQLLDYAQAHQNLLELVIHELDLVRAKLEKRKPTDIQIERNNKAKRLLGTQKKEGT